MGKTVKSGVHRGFGLMAAAAFFIISMFVNLGALIGLKQGQPDEEQLAQGKLPYESPAMEMLNFDLINSAKAAPMIIAPDEPDQPGGGGNVSV